MSQFANAGQEKSQLLDVSVEVSPSCTVSTERGAAGAELDSGCPAYTKQSLAREFVLSPEVQQGGSTTSEQLVLVINF